MSKFIGGFTCRLLSPRWPPLWTRTRFSSYLPLFHSHSLAESSRFGDSIKRLERSLSVHELTSTAYQQLIQTCKEDVAADASVQSRGRNHVQATPLVDVLYVTVKSKKSDDCEIEKRPPLQVYGVIQLIDEQNNTYDVYRRESNNPEIVSHGGYLSLTRPDGTPTSLFLPCVSALKMRVHLRDAAAEGIEIAVEDIDIHLIDEYVTDYKQASKVVDGRGGSASVAYATRLYAVIAKVELSLTKNDETDSDQSHAHIYGTISASSEFDRWSISGVLLNRDPSEPIMVDLAAPIKLSKDVVAVPAYSGFQIKIDLWDYHTNQQIASDVAYFDAKHGGWDVHNLDLGQNYRIKVGVTWSHAYQHVFESSGYAFDDQKLLCGQLRSLASHRLSPYLDFELSKSYPSMDCFRLTLVEVFSISITLHDNAVGRVCGTIKVYDANNYGENTYCIFERNYLNPEILDEHMKLKTLKWPIKPFVGPCFGMHLHLTDIVGHEICKGYLDWDIHQANYPISRYGKRLSSVIRGQHGYATVHYAFFDRTIIAKVKAVFIPNRSFDVPFKIFGDIVARYSTFIYSTYSEKMHFQSTLFGDNHHIIVVGGSPLVLKKSVIPVPYGSSLIMDVKLHAQAMCESSQCTKLEHFGSLDKVVNFDVDVDETCIRRIEGKDFHIDLFVEWISG